MNWDLPVAIAMIVIGAPEDTKETHWEEMRKVRRGKTGEKKRKKVRREREGNGKKKEGKDRVVDMEKKK